MLKHHKLFIIILFIFIACPIYTYSSGGGYSSYNVLDLGIGFEHTYNKNIADNSLFITHKGGFFSLGSLLYSLDVSYRIKEEIVVTKFGLDLYVLILGLQSGFVMAIDPNKDENSKIPGLYLGLAGGLPLNNPDIFFSIGSNVYFYSRATLELYLSISVLINFCNNKSHIF